MTGKCAHCGKAFTRRHPSQRFCAPVRGQRVCKDAYHNTRQVTGGQVTPARRAFVQRTTPHTARPAAREERDSWDEYVDSIPFGSEESFDSPF